MKLETWIAVLSLIFFFLRKKTYQIFFFETEYCPGSKTDPFKSNYLSTQK